MKCSWEDDEEQQRNTAQNEAHTWRWKRDGGRKGSRERGSNVIVIVISRVLHAFEREWENSSY